MKSFLCAILVTTAFATGGPGALGASTNPILRLYEERLELARLEFQKVERMKAFVEERKKALEKAFTQGAVPERSILEITRQAGMAKSLERLLQSQVKQAEALVVLAERMISTGQDMPFCLKD